MKISFFGYHEAICKCFDKAFEKGYDIKSVVTSDLNEKRWYRSLEELALEKQVPIYKPASIDREIIQEIKKQDLDLIVVIDYHKILPKEIIDAPKLGTVNFHASLLPKYRGNAPLIRAIYNNDRGSGTTLHYLDIGVDTGDIIGQQKFSIDSTDAIKDIILKHNEACVHLFEEYMPMIEKGAAPRTVQPEKDKKACKWVYHTDGRINLNDSVLQAYNKIRALASPFPNAFFEIDNKKIFIDLVKEN